MPQGSVNVALIGQGFMGRTHSNAWGQVAKFFKPPLRPVMHTVFGQPEENPAGLRRQLGLAERLDRLAGAGPLARDRPGGRGHAQLHARPGGQGGHRRRQARSPARSRSPARWPRPGRWPQAGQAGQGQDLRLVQLPPLPGRGPGPPAGQGRASSATSATCGRSICRTGPTRTCRWLGGSTRSWPAPAPTAT